MTEISIDCKILPFQKKTNCEIVEVENCGTRIVEECKNEPLTECEEIHTRTPKQVQKTKRYRVCDDGSKTEIGANVEDADYETFDA